VNPLALRVLRPAAPCTWGEIVAAVGALAIPRPIGVGLAALVVGSGIVMGAISADVKIRAAAGTHVAKADALSGNQRNFLIAGEAVHALTVGQ